MSRIEQRNKLDDLDGLVEEIELEEIDQELQPYLVKYPDEQMIGATIDRLRPYVRAKKKRSFWEKERLFTLLKHSGAELAMISKLYWVVSALLFILGYLITVNSAFQPMLTLLILGPIPFVLGLLEVFKAREIGLLEMEMTCKFSARQIMLSRLSIISLYNLGLNMIMVIAFAPLLDAATIWQMLFVWSASFTLFAGLCLWLSIKLRGALFLTSVLALWLLLIFLFAAKPGWLDVLVNQHLFVYLLCTALGGAILLLQMKQLWRKNSFMEGEEAFEANY